MKSTTLLITTLTALSLTAFAESSKTQRICGTVGQRLIVLSKDPNVEPKDFMRIGMELLADDLSGRVIIMAADDKIQARIEKSEGQYLCVEGALQKTTENSVMEVVALELPN